MGELCEMWIALTFLSPGAYNLPQWRSGRNHVRVDSRPAPLPRSRQPSETYPPIH